MPPNRKLIQFRWRGYALSILLHSALVAAAVYGWFTWKHRAPDVDTLAIEGSVVDERVLKSIAAMPEAPPEKPPEPEPVPVPEPEPEPAPVEEQGPPAPDPAELERKEEERLAQEQKQKEEAEQKAAQELKEREEAERVEKEKQAAAKAAEEKAAKEKAAAEKKAAEKKKAEEAAAAKKAAEEKARLARQAELMKSLEAEERGNAARNSSEASQWRAAIAAKIQRNWKTPPSAVTGVECNVTVTQVPGGDVTDVRGIKCNVDDPVLSESLRNAVMGASPLPPPPAGVPFERILELTFKPQ